MELFNKCECVPKYEICPTHIPIYVIPPIESSSITEYIVKEINRLDLQHRKGWRPSDYKKDKVPRLTHLKGELKEFYEAINDLKKDPQNTQLKAHVKEEMGDVFACLLQTAYRLGISFENLDREAEHKIRIRFNGTQAILQR